MKHSYQHCRQLYQSFEDERLMKQWLCGNLSHNSEAALKVELKHRGLDCAAETSNLLELSECAIEREINRGSVWKALFRMLSVAAILLVIALVSQGYPSLDGITDIETLLTESLHCIVLGPALFVSQFSQNVGLIISVIFWTSLIVTALGSGDTRVQRWF